MIDPRLIGSLRHIEATNQATADPHVDSELLARGWVILWFNGGLKITAEGRKVLRDD